MSAPDTFSDVDDTLMAQMLYVDAVIGVGFPTMQVAEHAERGGLATYIGDQHNWKWAWRREALEALQLSTLIELYTSLKKASMP
jgi:hypothetical protein